MSFLNCLSIHNFLRFMFTFLKLCVYICVPECMCVHAYAHVNAGDHRIQKRELCPLEWEL